jgi:alginate O-acetyltransferase complex protein AlgI
MLFNSWIFLGFLSIVFITYYLLPKLNFGASSQISLLFLSSLIFYAYKTPSLVLLLLFSLLINSFFSKKIVLATTKHRKSIMWLWIAILANLLILSFFKYASLIASLILPEGSFIETKNYLASIPLPIGISFYTFQAISLIVDLNRQGIVKVASLEKNFQQGKNKTGFLKIAFYISFFPQLIAGPIVKAHDFINQIETKHFKNINWLIVVQSIIIGYFLKMVIADNLKEITFLLNNERIISLGKIDLIVLLYGYSFQIFADFAGYSLIAIGLGAMFGYKFPINFNFPYISGSLTEFWQRWHISLSSFLREYLYIPLGGNRKGKIRTYINLFIVMFLGGLWHGAAWSYAIWGVAHGIILAIEKFYSDVMKNRKKAVISKTSHLVKIFITFHIVSLLWLLFIMPDFNRVVQYFHLIVSQEKIIKSPQHIYIVLVYGFPIVIYHLAAYFREHSINNNLILENANIKAFALSTMLFFIILNSGTNGDFIYFQF